MLALCARTGVPRPLVNAVVAGLEVDFYWPASGLVVEADSRRHHLSPSAFERDRERDAILLRHGLRVLRLTHARIEREPGAVGADLLALTSPGRLSVPGERKAPSASPSAGSSGETAEARFVHVYKGPRGDRE